MKNIGIIIQARTNSKRLKGKILKKLGDKPLIEWVIKRLKKTKVNNIILATSKNSKDLELRDICIKEKISFFNGSEKNVLERFYQAAKQYKLDAIIRVCADNPFVDSEEINLLINKFKSNNFEDDYYFNHRNYEQNRYADGFGAELFKFSTLEHLYKNSTKKEEREHVTAAIWNKRFAYKVVPCKTNINKKFHHVVCDINNLNDYNKIKKFIKNKQIKFTDKAEKIVKLYSLFEIENDLKNLFFVNRSLAGSENRKTLRYLKKDIPLKIKSFSTGQKVFDWTIPKEWKIKKGYIKDYLGNNIIDIKNNYLHVASYSQRVNKEISLDELKKKIFTSKSPAAIPYRTLYYKKDWAFCLSKNNLKVINKIGIRNKKFKVCIDSKFIKGKMNYGEILIPGKSKKEILISTYICHPSMANDNLSGVILTSLLVKYIKSINNLKWSYRIIFIPETIGAIAYLKKNQKKIKKIDFGINVSCVGGKGIFSYKETFNSDHFLNKIVKDIFVKKKIKFRKFKFDIHGSDERQYSYSGNSVNMISIHKDKFYDYKEYHTSLDNLDFVKDKQIFSSFLIYQDLIQEIEKQEIYENYNHFSEPMLSKHKLYPDTGGSLMADKNKTEKKLDYTLWILFLCDGKKTLTDIKKVLNISDKSFFMIIKELKEKKLINHV